MKTITEEFRVKALTVKNKNFHTGEEMSITSPTRSHCFWKARIANSPAEKGNAKHVNPLSRNKNRY